MQLMPVESIMLPLWTIEELKALTSPHLRPAVHVYDTQTRLTHMGIYSPRDEQTVRVMYGATCHVIIVSWEQLRDALDFQRPLTA